MSKPLTHIFANTIASLIPPSPTRCLLAISGGVDSVAMGHLFVDYIQKNPNTLSCGVIHIHHGLRPEATHDQQFTASLAQQWQLPFYTHQLDLKPPHPQGLQAQARNQRYVCYQRTMQQNNYTYLATAHHLDDALETTLLFLARGAGLRGLLGIAPKRKLNNPNPDQWVIRPLHTLSKQQILAWMQNQKHPWQEDASNQQNNYRRNALRQQVIAPLKALYPSFITQYAQSLSVLRKSYTIIQQATTRWIDEHLSPEDGYDLLHLPIDMGSIEQGYVSEYLTQQVGMRMDVCESLWQAWKNKRVGKYVTTPTHRVYVERAGLLLLSHTERMAREAVDPHGVEVRGAEVCYGGYRLCIKNYTDLTEALLRRVRAAQAHEVYLDGAIGDLVLRRVQVGDVLQPLGMRNKKKVRHVLIDAKVPLALKMRVCVLEAKQGIVWVIGHSKGQVGMVTQKSRSILHAWVRSVPLD